MKPVTKTVDLSAVIFDDKVYPRKEHSPALVQRYAGVMDEIEAHQRYMSVSSDMILLDGRHRHLAYLKNANGNDPRVTVLVYPVDDAAEKFALAVKLNSDHGFQLSPEDKRRSAIQLYANHGYTVEKIADIVSVRKQTALDWTKNIRKEEERQRDETIAGMWLACHMKSEIAEAIGITQQRVGQKIETMKEKFPGTKLSQLAFSDESWTPPLYNVWTFAKKTNEVSRFGNSEQRILENLLYLYTKPFDIVLDPFAGGGSTIDVCKMRGRRYWASDRKPPVERDDVRMLDVIEELPPLNKRWSSVALTYLDPPYWKQAEGQYSDDDEDLANMPLDKFTASLVGLVKSIARKQSRGAIALLIQPTQWKSEGREFTDHILDILQGVKVKGLVLENRVSCPYSTEQYNAQQVTWAKENKKLLALTRELIIWRLDK